MFPFQVTFENQLLVDWYVQEAYAYIEQMYGHMRISPSVSGNGKLVRSPELEVQAPRMRFESPTKAILCVSATHEVRKGVGEWTGEPTELVLQYLVETHSLLNAIVRFHVLGRTVAQIEQAKRRKVKKSDYHEVLTLFKSHFGDDLPYDSFESIVHHEIRHNP